MIEDIDVVAVIENVARTLIGEPNRSLSSKTQLRYGKHGSLSVEISGDNKGTWYDHEQKIGGGVIDLICAKTGKTRRAAAEWLKQESGIFDQPTLPQPERDRRAKPNLGPVVATYSYIDEAGALLFQVCRFEPQGRPKTFLQRKPSPGGAWSWNTDGVRKVPYRLPELLERPDDCPVLIVEGEKDVERLRSLGLVATCNPGGAGKWRSEYNDALAGATVYILPDNDEAGRSHAISVAESLHSHQVETHIVHLPGLPPKGDVSNWLDMGGSADELLDLCYAARDAATAHPGDAPIQEAKPEPIDQAAFYGVIGQIIRKIEPETESDPAALLVQMVTALGSIIGKTAYVQVESTRHYPNLFTVVCGDTASARKGTGWRRIRNVAREVDDTWPKCGSGVASGEGVIDAVHDAEYGVNKKGMKVLKREAVEDKRLLIVEEEFARLLRVAAREGNITSQVLRDAWDGGDLRSMARGTGVTATDPHVSIIGHITRDELMEVTGGSSLANGFYNRFLWIFSQRSKLLPFGGNDVDVTAEIMQIRQALCIRREDQDMHGAGNPLRMKIDKTAIDAWRTIYAQYSGDMHPMKARAAPLVLRIALVFAFLEIGTSTIHERHLTAANAIVAYSLRTIDWLVVAATANTPRERILAAVEVYGEMTASQLHELFARHLSGRVIANLCEDMARDGALTKHKGQVGPAGGRPAIIWRATRPMA